MPQTTWILEYNGQTFRLSHLQAAKVIDALHLSMQNNGPAEVDVDLRDSSEDIYTTVQIGRHTDFVLRANTV